MGEHRTALILLLILCFAIFTLPLVRATPELWSQTYGGELDESARSLVVTSDGGYALAGYTKDEYNYYSDFLLVKTDANGNMEWNKTYERDDNDWLMLWFRPLMGDTQ